MYSSAQCSCASKGIFMHMHISSRLREKCERVHRTYTRVYVRCTMVHLICSRQIDMKILQIPNCGRLVMHLCWCRDQWRALHNFGMAWPKYESGDWWDNVPWPGQGVSTDARSNPKMTHKLSTESWKGCARQFGSMGWVWLWVNFGCVKKYHK